MMGAEESMADIIYRKVTSAESTVHYVTDVIANKLATGKKVLWLIAGGSAIKVAVEVSQKLPKNNLQNLTVTLTDERYGPVGHADSNWPQLLSAGFKLDGANMQPVLKGNSIVQTAKDYSETLKEDLKRVDYSIALAGMGPDGHIYGIKSGSPSVRSNHTVVAYKWDDYERITPTIKFIIKLDETVMYVAGQEKWSQLDDLDKDLDPNKQPAQLLKNLKKVIIFNDHKGEVG